ncbi:MAG: gamma-glutamyltransferase, partial [Armatimonadota bacterium]
MAHTARPDFRARRQAVAAGHYLAAMAGHDILRDGGNAADAAAAVAFCLSVLEPHQNGPAGECPALVHFGGKTYAVSGQGSSPAGLTLEWFRKRGYELIPGDGLLPATVPA